MSKFKYLNRQLVFYKFINKTYSSILDQFSKMIKTNTTPNDSTTFRRAGNTLKIRLKAV